MKLHLCLIVLCLLALSLAGAGAQPTGAQEKAPAAPANVAHFHHLHLNATDPAAAVNFYTSKFDSEKATFQGEPAVWAQKSWLLFNKVKSAPPWELTSAVWHFGWGAEDMKAEYERQLKMGTKFFTPITDISDLARVQGFYYAYVDGPDHALIELNTAPHHHFGHLHLFSEDPVSAGEWYMKYFGATRRGSGPPSREPRTFRGFQIGPSMSLMMDNVNIIIYPIQYSHQAYPEHWKNVKTTVSPTRGRVVDHVAFSFDNLDEAVERMRKDGVKIVEAVKTDRKTHIKHAFVEGPDHLLVELVEGHARKQ